MYQISYKILEIEYLVVCGEIYDAIYTKNKRKLGGIGRFRLLRKITDELTRKKEKLNFERARQVDFFSR